MYRREPGSASGSMARERGCGEIVTMAPDWLGILVIAFVCFWMALVRLVLLRTAFFLLMLVWMGARQWYDDVRPGTR